MFGFRSWKLTNQLFSKHTYMDSGDEPVEPNEGAEEGSGQPTGSATEAETCDEADRGAESEASQGRGEEDGSSQGTSEGGKTGQGTSEGSEASQGTSEEDGTAEEAVAEDTAASTIAVVRENVTKRRLLGGSGILLAIVVVILVVAVPSSLLALVYTSSAAFEAQPATAQADAFTASEYEHVESDQLVVEEQIEAIGQERTIVVTNHLTNYERTIDVQGESFDSAVFTVVSSPAIEVAGNPANPLADMSHHELLTEFSDELEGGYDELGDIEKMDEHEGVMLGQHTTVSQFEMTVVEDGEEIAVYLYVADVQSEGDIVVAVGGHPAPFAQERASIFELLAGVEHPAG